jgi:hypothetical protein
MGMAEEQKQQWEVSGLTPSRPALTIALAPTLSPMTTLPSFSPSANPDP